MTTPSDGNRTDGSEASDGAHPGPGRPGTTPNAPGAGQRLPVRRSVNYAAFLLTGAVAGFVLGGLLELVGPTPSTGAVYTGQSSFAFVAMLGALLGTLVGGVVALLLDRRG